MASNMRNRKALPKDELGDSWVVESSSDGDDEADDLGAKVSKQPKQERSIHTSRSGVINRRQDGQRPSMVSDQASPEPELIMPSIDEGISRHTKGLRKQKAAPAQRQPAVDGRNEVAIENESQRDSHSKFKHEAEEIENALKSVLRYTIDIAGRTFEVLKIPISYGLAIYILFGLMLLTRNLLMTSISSALSPICRLPGSSLLNLEMCKSPITGMYIGDKAAPAEFDQLMMVQSKFEEILEQSSGGVSLPLDMKRGEASIRDLRQVVRYSQLHSKNELVLEFDGFIETARIASFDLQKFNSHVGRAVDNILSTARWTERVLQGIAEKESNRGSIAVFVGDRLLAPFQPIKLTEDAVLDQYIQHTRIVEDEIHRLIAEAQALLLVLQNLEDRLDLIHGISIRDKLHATGSKDEILAQLWTKLGGNRKELGQYNSQLRLLQQVNTYRQSAFAHVAGTILKLQSMESELEELRERMGSTELLQQRTDVPLQVHIENIKLGVERLEIGRGNSKQSEEAYLRRTLDRKDDMVEGKLIGS